MRASAKATIKASLNAILGIAFLITIVGNAIVGFLQRDTYNIAVATFLLLLFLSAQLTAMTRPNVNVTVNGQPSSDAFDEALRRHFPPTSKM